MVVQAVHSGDKRLLEQALIVNNERLVVSTVRKLPVTAVIPFLKIVSDMTYIIYTRYLEGVAVNYSYTWRSHKCMIWNSFAECVCCKFKGHMIIVDLS